MKKQSGVVCCKIMWIIFVICIIQGSIYNILQFGNICHEVLARAQQESNVDGIKEIKDV